MLFACLFRLTISHHWDVNFSLFESLGFFGFSSSDLAGPDERRLTAEGFDFLLFFKWFFIACSHEPYSYNKMLSSLESIGQYLLILQF